MHSVAVVADVAVAALSEAVAVVAEISVDAAVAAVVVVVILVVVALRYVRMLTKRDGPQPDVVPLLEHPLEQQVRVVGASRQATKPVGGPRDLQLEEAPLWTLRPRTMGALASRPPCHNTNLFRESNKRVVPK